MNWTDDEMDEGCKAFSGVNPDADSDLSRREVRAIMTRAVELAAARGGKDEREEEGKHLGTVVAASDVAVRQASAAWLSRRLAARASMVAALDAEKARLALHVNNLSDANADLHRQNAELDRKKAAFQAKVAELDAKLTHEAQHSAALDAEYHEAVRERDVDRRQLEEWEATYKQALEQLRAEVDTLKSRCDVLRERSQTAEGEMLRYRQEVEGLEAEKKNLEEYVLEIGRALRAHPGFEASVAASLLKRAETAESRLAAVREGFEQVEGEKGLARWALEGSKPKCDGVPEQHGGACSPGCVEHGVKGGAQQDAKCQHPDDMDLMCIACDQCTVHRWMPSPDAGPGWRCSECSALSNARRYPCSPTCTHDDAATPGHPLRVKERSEAFDEVVDAAKDMGVRTDLLQRAHDNGAEAMRAACWEAVQAKMQIAGYTKHDAFWVSMQAAIEGATP